MSDADKPRKLHLEHGKSRLATGASGGIILDPPIYRAYIQPDGWLTADLACHALFHYNNTAIEVYKSEKEDIKLEGYQGRLNLHQLYTSIATLYGVDPNDMGKYWPAVDLQIRSLGLTQLPKGTDMGINWRDPKRGLN